MYNSILDHAKHKLSQVRLIVGDVWNHAYAELAFTSLDSRVHKFFSLYTCKCVSNDLLNNQLSLMAEFSQSDTGLSCKGRSHG